MTKSVSINITWIAFVIAVFGTVYQRSGTFVYVEGDDAASIAYHLLGRDPSLQPPYAAYHGMMDALLSVLPAREHILRIVSFEMTRVANIIMFILVMALAFDWTQSIGPEYSRRRSLVISTAVLLAVPELFYFGLVYSPTSIAMCLVLTAHLLVRRFCRSSALSRPEQLVSYAFSLLLFGLGSAFRWNVMTYGLVIVADLSINKSVCDSPRNRLAFPAAWGIIALVSSLLMINLSGYGYADLVDSFPDALAVMHRAGTMGPDMVAPIQTALMHTILTLSPMFTPVFVFLIIVGSSRLIVNRHLLGIVILAGIVGALPWVRSGVPKFLIVSLPSLIVLFILGLDSTWGYLTKRMSAVLSLAILAPGLFIPWLIGIQLHAEGTSWGPAFELRPYDRRDIEGFRFTLSLEAGTAFPTTEGPRAVYGHGYALLGGAWKEFVQESARERHNVIETALTRDVPLVVTRWSSEYFVDDLYSMGFRTVDPYTRMTGDRYFSVRRFVNAQNRTLSLYYHEVGAGEVDEFILRVSQSSLPDVIAIIGYSKTMRRIHEAHPSAMESIGPTSALLHLQSLKRMAAGSTAQGPSQLLPSRESSPGDQQ